MTDIPGYVTYPSGMLNIALAIFNVTPVKNSGNGSLKPAIFTAYQRSVKEDFETVIVSAGGQS